MIIPPLHGKLEQQGLFVYIACDQHYFTEFGKSLINSVKANSQLGVHIHLYNPLPEQIAYCQQQSRVSITFEFVPLELFKSAADRWNTISNDLIEQNNLKRIVTAMSKSNDVSIQERIQRTYYACARFVRLAELISTYSSVLAIDSDAIIRANIPSLPAIHDFYIHHITGKKARFLAGGIYLTGSEQGYNFLKEYAEILKYNINHDKLHWGIDQDVLDDIVPKYNFGHLPLAYIDWEMLPSSYVWTAKGKRKELAVFINEQKKYNF